MSRAFKATETVSTPEGDFILSINIGVIDAIEDDFDLDFDSVVALVGKGRLGKIAKFLRGLLLPHHSGITLDDTFVLAREHGDLFTTGMQRLIAKAQPDAAEAKDENPPNAQHGTGGSSSSHGARPGSRRASSGSKRLEPSS